MDLVKLSYIGPTLMAFFHIDAFFTNDLLQQIINADDIVLQLKMRNPICEQCITAGQ